MVRSFAALRRHFSSFSAKEHGMTEMIALDGAWDAVTGTGKGPEIDAATGKLFSGELALAPPLPDLGARLAPALARLCAGPRRLAVVSVADAVSATASMDERRADDYVDGLCAVLPGIVSDHLGGMIDRSYRPAVSADPRARAMVDGTMFFVVSCLCAARPFKPSAGTRFLRALHGERSVRSVAFYLAMTIALELDGAEDLRALADLYALGNFPIGLQRDGAFVVLVA
jgi:hypothetical protein